MINIEEEIKRTKAELERLERSRDTKALASAFLKEATLQDIQEVFSITLDEEQSLESLVNNGFLSVEMDSETGLSLTFRIDLDFMKSTLGVEE